MGLVQHAERELRLAGLFDEDSDYGGLIAKSVMELVKVFAKQGHSGGSMGGVINIFSRVARYGTLAPIQGTDDEWFDHQIPGDNLLQNTRNGAVFKDGDNCFYLDAVVFRNQHGSTYTKGGRGKGSSAQFIKEFPFVPKTFYIDVIDYEVAPDDWEHKVKDESQWDAVFEYYKDINTDKKVS